MLSRQVQSIYPLSPLQQGLVYHALLDERENAYIVQVAVQLTGDVNPQRLRTAWERLIYRHDVFRTLFKWNKEDRYLQVVLPEVATPWREEDWSSHSEAEQKQALVALLKEDRDTPYDLAQAPLMRLILIKEADTRYRFVWSHHHVLLDGWSMSLVMGELFQIYGALGADTPEGLAPVRPFRDYIQWLDRRDDQAAKNYWRDYLTGFNAPTALPSATVQPDEEQGDSLPPRLDLLLETDESRHLNQFVRDQRLTLNVLVQGAWALLLGRLSGGEDVVFGAVGAGRPAELEGAETMVGPFIRTLPVRIALPGNRSVGDWLQELHRVSAESDHHGHLALTEIQAQSEIPSGTPMFESIVIFENYPVEQTSTGDSSDLALSEVLYVEKTHYPLTLMVVPGERLLLRAMFDRNHYTETDAALLLKRLRHLLRSFADAPETLLGRCDLLLAGERKQLLEQWNATEVPLATGLTIHGLFENQCRRTPEQTALVDMNESLSFAALDQAATRVAAQIAARGVEPGDRVAVCLDRTNRTLIAMLAVLKSGAAYLPMDPAHPPARLAYMLADSGARLVITDAAFDALLPEATPRLFMAQALAPESAPAPATTIQPNHAASIHDVAYLIYTSGSTGQPKGVSVTHDNVVNFFAGMDRGVGDLQQARQQPVWLAVTSISFDIAVLELFWTLCRGAKLVIHPTQKQPVAADALAHQPLDFSLYYFASDDDFSGPDKYRLLFEGARFADQKGFHSVWLPERHFHAFGGSYPNPAVGAAAVAAMTERVALRAGSVVAPLHDPIRIAEEWSMVDNISQGRIGLSFASGWHPDDFVLAQDRYAERKKILEEDLDQVRALWRGETVTRPNGIGNDTEVAIRPRPVQAELPVWLTAAGSPDTFRLAGRKGANILTHMLGQDPEELAEKIAVYREARLQAGLDPDSGRVTVMVHTFLGDDLENVRAQVREPFKNYLRSSVSLLTPLAKALGFDPKEHEEELVEQGFRRYRDSAALLGTPQSTLPLINKLKGMGVDEVACLIDFGVAADAVLAALPKLDELRRAANPGGPAPDLEKQSTAQLMQHFNVTHLQCTPSHARLIAADPAGRRALSQLDNLLLGGEPLPPDLAQSLLARGSRAIFNMYGPTETTIWSACGPVNQADGDFVSVGTPIANTQIYILDRRGRLVPPTVAGELFIGGRGVAAGYHNRPALTAARFLPDPFSSRPGARMYATGDLARFTPEGRLEVLGRLDFQVKIRGHRIELGEIEARLLAHSEITDCVVVADQDNAGEPRLVAYLVGRSEVQIPLLRDHLRAALPDIMVPAIFMFLDRLPLNVNGKIDRGALPKPEQVVQTQEGAFSVPRTPTEEILAGIWGDLLGLARVSRDADFFALGGHSLLAVQLISRIRGAFDLELPIGVLFQANDIGSLAERIDAAKAANRGLTQPPIERVARGRELPLSFGQQRLWFLNQLAPENPFYNMPYALRLHGTIRRDLLNQAFNEVIERQEVLRTTFPTRGDQAKQAIAAELILEIPLTDLSRLEGAAREAEVNRLIKEESNRPFQLAQGPLIRAGLLQLSEREHVLLFNLHHIIGDGWSMRVLTRELWAAYSARCAGTPNPLPVPEIQYADFAHWQRELLSGERLTQLFDHWTAKLAGAPHLLQLPTDKPRPERQTFHGARVHGHFPESLRVGLEELSRKHGATMYMTLLAAYALVLYGESSQTDLIIGAPLAKRNRRETEGLLGLFVDTLVLRNDLSGNPTFAELLARVKATLLEAFEHEDLPLDMLVEHLRPNRSLSYQPLVQTIFVYHNYPFKEEKITGAGLSVEMIHIDIYPSRLDLALNMGVHPEGGLELNLEYNTDLFHEDTMERYLTRFQRILEAVAADPAPRLNQLVEQAAGNDRREERAKKEQDFLAKLKDKRAKRRRRVTT